MYAKNHSSFALNLLHFFTRNTLKEFSWNCSRDISQPTVVNNFWDRMMGLNQNWNKKIYSRWKESSQILSTAHCHWDWEQRLNSFYKRLGSSYIGKKINNQLFLFFLVIIFITLFSLFICRVRVWVQYRDQARPLHVDQLQTGSHGPLRSSQPSSWSQRRFGKERQGG